MLFAYLGVRLFLVHVLILGGQFLGGLATIGTSGTGD